VTAPEEISQALAAGDIEQATTLALRLYGAEIAGYLAARVRDPDVAADVFAQFSEDLWKSFATFEGRASVRTWCYTLARHALSRDRKKAANRPGRNIPLSVAGVADELAEAARTATATYLQTEVKDRVRTLRESLDEEDRELLVLRVDRQLEWGEIAAIVLGHDASDDDVKKRSAALRKRFERVKQKLKERAVEAGLLVEAR